MSDPKNFLTRWSRRKREAVEEPEERKEPAPPAPGRDEACEDDAGRAKAAATPSGEPAATEPPFDLTRLPPLDSITAETDIRAFLAPGVPTDLARAALRRAWAADPKIRDFVGLADYDWDYHAPGSMAGFGPLEMTDDLRRLVARMVGGGAGEDEPDRAEATAASPAAAPGTQTAIESGGMVTEATNPRPQDDDPSETGGSTALTSSSRSPAQNDPAQHDKEDVALQHNSAEPAHAKLTAPRPHGRALPK